MIKASDYYPPVFYLIMDFMLPAGLYKLKSHPLFLKLLINKMVRTYRKRRFNLKRLISIFIILFILFDVSGCHYRDPYEAGHFTKQECLDTFTENKALFVKVAKILLANEDFFNSRPGEADIMTPNSIITDQKKYFTNDEWDTIVELFKTMPYDVARPESDVFEIVYINKEATDSYSFFFFPKTSTIQDYKERYSQYYPSISKLDEHWYFGSPNYDHNVT